MRKYYCDHCQKWIPNHREARRQHFDSLNHRMVAQEHYQQSQRHQPLPQRPYRPCHRYFQTGLCPFGAKCRYSHQSPSPYGRPEPRPVAAHQTPSSLHQALFHQALFHQASFHPLTHVHAQPPQPGPINIAGMPPELAAYPNLPPSLLPPSAGSTAPPIDWGM